MKLMVEKKTRRVHCYSHDYDVYIGRPGKWGNPFEIGRDGTRREVIEKFRAWIQEQPELLAEIESLRGKVLGCWCQPWQGCHGEVLIELVKGRLP